MDETRIADWSGGANNIAPRSRLPAATAARVVNLDPRVGGTLELRTGFTKQVEGANIRAVFALGGRLVFVDGAELKVHGRDGARTLATVAASGDVVGAELNGVLYISTATENLAFDGEMVRPWGTPPPAFGVAVVAGSLPTGVYRVAVTALGQHESGGDVMTLTLGPNSGLLVQSAAPGELRLYLSVANGEVLYSQGSLVGTREVSAFVVDDTEVLGTANLSPMPRVDVLVACGSVLVGARGRYVYRTEPFMPHLCDPVSGFFQYAGEVTLLAPAGRGLFVCADKTYFLSSPESPEQTQQGVLEFGAVRGTLAVLPDGAPAWFTQYGQAVGTADGSVRLLNQGTYAPDIVGAGAAGLMDYNGNQLVVTSLKGPTKSNQIAAADFWGVEIVDERTV